MDQDRGLIPSTRTRDLLWLAFFALPLALGLVLIVVQGKRWFFDLDAVLCGSWRVAHHGSAFNEAMACPGGDPEPYMYLPQMAIWFAPFLRGPDITLWREVLGPISMAGCLFLLNFLFIRPMEGASALARAPVLALVNGGTLVCGNVAVFCHGLVVAVAYLLPRRPWLLMVCIVAISVIKPVFLTYLLIYAYQAETLRTRATRIAGGIVLAGLVGALIIATAGPELAAWTSALSERPLGDQPGFGFLTILKVLDLAPTHLMGLGVYGLFAGLACLGGLAIVEVRNLGPRSRLLLAIAVAQIVNPRLMSYDLALLAPLAIAYEAVPDRLRSRFRAAVLAVGIAVVPIQFSPYRPVLLFVPTVLTLIYFWSAWLAAKDFPAWWSARKSAALVAA